MIKTVISIGITIIVVIGLYLLFSARTPSPKVELTQEIKKALQKARPVVSREEETYFSLLEKNAISGGPPKDGIPAIDNPEYTSIEEGDSWLLPQDIVFGINYKGFVAAYPQRILVWHEVLNETISDENLSVTYCPLTGTAIGFKGNIAADVPSTLGVLGKLVNSNLIMYDRVSDSYWPQIMGKAINGPAKGIRLDEFPVIWTTWEKWKKNHPDTKVLSRKTGFVRNYGERGDPYGSYLSERQRYYTSDRLLFKPIHEDKRLAPKTVVVGVRDGNGNAFAILKDTLRKRNTIEAFLGEKIVVVSYDPSLDFYTAKIKETEEWINAFDAMWFAWAAFYPDTKLIQ